MRIVVFGAGGCVGGWICEELSLRKGVELVACVRNWSSAVRIARRGIEVRRIDLEDVNELPALLTGADVVMNATMPAPSREPALVTGLYRAAAEAGVSRFIQFSSAAVYGDLTGDIDESTQPAPIDDYSRGKAEMERRVSSDAAARPTQLVILRPSIIYGPFSEGWTVRYVERVNRGRWRGLGRAGVGICNLIHAQDVARAAIAATTAELPPGPHVLNLNGPDLVTWNQYIELLGDELGLADRVVPSVARFRLMFTAARMLRLGSGMTWVRSLYRKSAGTTRALMTNAKDVTALYPSPGELSLLKRRARYSADRASRILGVSPTISLDTGVRQSISWCRLHGVV